MLNSLSVKDLGGGLNLVDIGCSGHLDDKWAPLASLINYIGFDPNAEECRRLNAEPSQFNSRLFLPYAVFDGHESPLYKTHSIYCHSLLPPNTAWLDRFAYRDLFTVESTERIATRQLDDVEDLRSLTVDVIKVDSQGLDRRILEHGPRIVEQALYIEAEPGFLENYQGEDTFAAVDAFLRDHGFLLFDLKLFRQPRNNPLGKVSPKQQLLWCQGTWKRDLVFPPGQTVSRSRALKALLLCALEGCWDYGFELAAHFHSQGLLHEHELEALASATAWKLH